MAQNNGFRNVEYTVQKDAKGKAKKLIIEIDLTAEPESSKTGKSSVLATTHGNQPLAELVPYKLGVNLYKSA